jgi:hypothetical protein
MKLNHFICPNCGHDFYDSDACATCDACHCFFYASQSKSRTRNENEREQGIVSYTNIVEMETAHE